MALVVGRLLSRPSDAAEMVGALASIVKRRVQVRRERAERKADAAASARVFNRVLLDTHSKARAAALTQSTPEVSVAPAPRSGHLDSLLARARRGS